MKKIIILAFVLATSVAIFQSCEKCEQAPFLGIYSGTIDGFANSSVAISEGTNGEFNLAILEGNSCGSYSFTVRGTVSGSTLTFSPNQSITTPGGNTATIVGNMTLTNNNNSLGGSFTITEPGWNPNVHLVSCTRNP